MIDPNDPCDAGETTRRTRVLRSSWFRPADDRSECGAKSKNNGRVNATERKHE
jgi:hypothetical protein